MTARIRIVCLLLVLIPSIVPAQERVDKKLQRSVESLVQGFNGQVGIYVKNLPHHTPDFYIDESGFKTGVKTFCNMVFDYMNMTPAKGF